MTSNPHISFSPDHVAEVKTKASDGTKHILGYTYESSLHSLAETKRDAIQGQFENNKTGHIDIRDLRAGLFVKLSFGDNTFGYYRVSQLYDEVDISVTTVEEDREFIVLFEPLDPEDPLILTFGLEERNFHVSVYELTLAKQEWSDLEVSDAVAEVLEKEEEETEERGFQGDTDEFELTYSEDDFSEYGFTETDEYDVKHIYALFDEAVATVFDVEEELFSYVI